MIPYLKSISFSVATDQWRKVSLDDVTHICCAAGLKLPVLRAGDDYNSFTPVFQHIRPPQSTTLKNVIQHNTMVVNTVLYNVLHRITLLH